VSDVAIGPEESALAYANNETIFRVQALVICVRGASSSFPDCAELSYLAEPGTRMVGQRMEWRDAIEYHRGDQRGIVKRIASEN
jgi:hypothetical protein